MDYHDAHKQFEALAATTSDPVEFFRRVRSEGCSRWVASLLLRDFYGKRLHECIEIDKAVSREDKPA